MDTCFVIQPFDNNKFDRRYDEIYKKVIEECGLEPYRVDRDSSAVILIDSIEQNIKNARIVLADITLDNPNVWYELGYAVANDKDVIMVCCSDERSGKFPFDISHRHIIQYSTSSPSEYESLKSNMKSKMKTYLSNTKKRKNNKESNNYINSIGEKEIALIASIMNNQFTKDDDVCISVIIEQMKKYGYSSLDTSFAIRKLTNNNMIISTVGCDINGNDYPIFKLTNEGEAWALKNESSFGFLHIVKECKNIDESEMPF